jgi:hypothetical protein
MTARKTPGRDPRRQEGRHHPACLRCGNRIRTGPRRPETASGLCPACDQEQANSKEQP